RWPGPITVLVDAMTYSAAEDFLLGLQGLEHVTVLGEPTGGGSGRPRTIAITPDLTLSISTALTYDRRRRCIELNGLPVDGPADLLAAHDTASR
ncbi:MAG: S41 family peptidase, partial [Actinomycetota bacterium]|nr:S41 family peptidase [Actinomycetota bacterium]